jgi:hypothetical protein
MANEKVANAGTYAQRLIENEYVQENLAQAAESLRAAYRRASKRRVEPTRDEKFRRQVREAANSLREAASALQSGRRGPKKRRGRRVVILLSAGAAAAAVVLASNDELRRQLLGDGAAGGGGMSTAPRGDGSQAPVAT